MAQKFMGSDGDLRTLDEHIAYLEGCALAWERGGGAVGKPDQEQAARVRTQIATLKEAQEAREDKVDRAAYQRRHANDE